MKIECLNLVQSFQPQQIHTDMPLFFVNGQHLYCALIHSALLCASHSHSDGGSTTMHGAAALHRD